MALKRAVEINQGRGLSGMPVRGQDSRAAANASCMASSARSRSASSRTSVARIRPDSDRQRVSMVVLSCSGTSCGIPAKLANGMGRHNCARPSPAHNSVARKKLRSLLLSREQRRQSRGLCGPTGPRQFHGCGQPEVVRFISHAARRRRFFRSTGWAAARLSAL